jgi:hypothetical protein
MEPTELSMLELGKKLGSGELSSVEAVRACLAAGGALRRTR